MNLAAAVGRNKTKNEKKMKKDGAMPQASLLFFRFGSESILYVFLFLS